LTCLENIFWANALAYFGQRCQRKKSLITFKLAVPGLAGMAHGGAAAGGGVAGASASAQAAAASATAAVGDTVGQVGTVS